MDLNCETMINFPQPPSSQDDLHINLTHADHLYHRRGFSQIMESVYNCTADIITIADNAILMYHRTHYLRKAGYITAPINIAPPIMGDGNLQDILTLLRDHAQQNECTLHLTTTEQIQRASEFETIQPNMLSILKLPTSPDERFACYKKRQRSKVRSVIKQNADLVTLSWGKENDLKEWFTILQNLYRHKHRMITQPYALYQKLYQQGYGHLLIAKCNKTQKILGGLFMLCDHNFWEYGWGAVTPQGQSQSIMTLLMDQAIQCAIISDAKEFNFGASPNSDTDLRFFKTRWGAEERPLTHLFYNQPAHVTDLNNSYQLIRKLIPYVPNPIMGAVSRIAVPYLI